MPLPSMRYHPHAPVRLGRCGPLLSLSRAGALRVGSRRTVRRGNRAALPGDGKRWRARRALPADRLAVRMQAAHMNKYRTTSSGKGDDHEPASWRDNRQGSARMTEAGSRRPARRRRHPREPGGSSGSPGPAGGEKCASGSAGGCRQGWSCAPGHAARPPSSSAWPAARCRRGGKTRASGAGRLRLRYRAGVAAEAHAPEHRPPGASGPPSRAACQAQAAMRISGGRRPCT